MKPTEETFARDQIRKKGLSPIYFLMKAQKSSMKAGNQRAENWNCSLHCARVARCLLCSNILPKVDFNDLQKSKMTSKDANH